jgi:hypothetical protein
LIMTVPVNEYFPSISEPSSMKAVRSLVLVGRLVFLHGMPTVGGRPLYLSPLK